MAIVVRPFREVKRGDTNVVLECDILSGGDPEPEVQWFRMPDMVPIPSSDFPNYVSTGHDLRNME